MAIERIGVGTRWSDMVVHNGTVYVVEVPATTDADLATQTREVLASLEESLSQAGSSKAHLLMVTIYLADIGGLAAFNAIWDAWLPPGAAPVRACVQARLGHPGYQVELQVTAATAAP